MTKFLKKIAPFLILGSFLILSALLPEILGEDAKVLAKSFLGDNYKYILVAFFLLLFLLAAYINPEMGLGLFSKTDKNNPERYNIPPTDENHELLRKAKAAIATSHPDQALELLSTLKLKTLDIEITALSARLSDLERTQRFGTESHDTETREHNKINKSVIFLITALEKEIAQSFEFYDKIRAALKSRYETRLSQKLSNRQPVNLRLVPSTAGTTPQAANTFVQYSEGESRGKLAEYYKDANGRLLLVGVPGAGKTTLLLQLELELLEKEITRIPVILNLARWSSEFPTLEDWIQDILPSEMGLTINKKVAGDLIAQNRLILLLDGLDEVKAEDRQTCLEAIGVYGQVSNRRFVISSRTDQYEATSKDAPVNYQVEVGTLTRKQLIDGLGKIDTNEGSQRLLTALKKDDILREIAEVPFYFNTLQLLFARGKYLHEFNFSAFDIEGRKKELEQYFVSEMFRTFTMKNYDAQLANKYLGFFASRLNHISIVDFELTHLQYDWGKLSRRDFIIGNFLKNLVKNMILVLFYALVFGLVTGYVLSPALGIFTSLVIILLIGLFMVGDYQPVIETRENIKWKGWISRENLALILTTSPLAALAVSLVAILVYNAVDNFFFILIHTLIMALGGGLLTFLYASLMLQIDTQHYYFVQINKPYQRFKASAKVLYFSIIQHWHLSYLLHKKGLLPKKMVVFLNDMVKCNILETTGASWRFRHSVLQAYFSDKWVELEIEPDQKENSPAD